MILDRTCTVALTPSQIYRLLTSEPFQTAKAAAVDASGFGMTQSSGDGVHVVQTVRSVSALRLPDFVRPLVHPTLVVTETERWTLPSSPDLTPTEADFAIDVQGAPVEVRGRLTLLGTEEGTQLRYSGEITAKVPLFRKQVAEAALGPIRDTISAEFALLESALTRMDDYLG